MLKKHKSQTKARERRQQLARETLEIITSGSSSVAKSIEDSVNATQSFSEAAVIPKPLPIEGGYATTFSVINTTTLDAARMLLNNNPNEEVAVLNFASAKNPGGGFIRGSMAQEESLALHSGMYATLQHDAMYDHHRTMKGGVYTDWCIYSPKVPVFRDEMTGELLETSWSMSMITSPCLNRSTMVKTCKISHSELHRAIRKRMVRFLDVLAAHHVGNLVLGAWGCGVFGNDPNMVASIFREVLTTKAQFRNRWRKVVFAVLDNSPRAQTLRAFQATFETN